MKNLFSAIFEKMTKKDDSEMNNKRIFKRSNFNRYLDSFTPSELEEMTLIVIKLDNYDGIIDQRGKRIAKTILEDFHSEMLSAASNEQLVSQWSEQELILSCPHTSIGQAINIAKRIKNLIQSKTWKDNFKTTTSIGISELAEEPLYKFISRLQNTLHNQGINTLFVDNEKPKKSPLPLKKSATNNKICAVTGGLNYESFTKYLTTLSPATRQEMSIIFIDIANLEDLTNKYGLEKADKISRYVAQEIAKTSELNGTLGALNKKLFLLMSPNTSTNQGKVIATEIKTAIENRTWLTAIDIQIGFDAFDAKKSTFMPAATSQSSSEKNTKSASTSKTKNEQALEFNTATMTCASTGALNQLGLKTFLQQSNSALLQEMSVIFIDITQSPTADASTSKVITEAVSQQFVENINQISVNGIIARFNPNKYLLLCPKTALTEATAQATEIRATVKGNHLSNETSLLCQTEVYDSNWQDQVAQVIETSHNIAAEETFEHDNVSRISAA